MNDDNNILDFKKVQEYNKKKKLLEKSEKVVEELSLVLYIFDLTINGLSNFKKYVFVMECISVLQNNKILLEIHLNKYKKAILKIKEEMENVRLEKAPEENS